jgi:hypothetical protein
MIRVILRTGKVVQYNDAMYFNWTNCHKVDLYDKEGGTWIASFNAESVERCESGTRGKPCRVYRARPLRRLKEQGED